MCVVGYKLYCMDMMFVTGWHPERVVFCEMHVMHLGICQWLNAAGIALLSDLGYLDAN